MATAPNISLTEQILELLNRGKKREQIIAQLLEQGHEEYHLRTLLQEAIKMRQAKARSQALLLILVGAAICLLSCILTITSTSTNMPMVLFGLTTLGIIIVFAGLVKIFG